MTTRYSAPTISDLTQVCSRGHVDNGYNDDHGSWCTKCGSSVGYFATKRETVREWFRSGAIDDLPAIFR